VGPLGALLWGTWREVRLPWTLREICDFDLSRVSVCWESGRYVKKRDLVKDNSLQKGSAGNLEEGSLTGSLVTVKGISLNGASLSMTALRGNLGWRVNLLGIVIARCYQCPDRSSETDFGS